MTIFLGIVPFRLVPASYVCWLIPLVSYSYNSSPTVIGVMCNFANSWAPELGFPWISMDFLGTCHSPNLANGLVQSSCGTPSGRIPSCGFFLPAYEMRWSDHGLVQNWAIQLWKHQAIHGLSRSFKGIQRVLIGYVYIYIWYITDKTFVFVQKGFTPNMDIKMVKPMVVLFSDNVILNYIKWCS